MFGKGSKSIPTLLGELKDLTIDYTKQETITPLKNLGRYIAFGLAGSAAISIGLFMWFLALLRALQNETGTAFTGHLTWVPYILTLIACGIVIAIGVSLVTSDRRKSEQRKAERAREEARKDRATAVSQ